MAIYRGPGGSGDAVNDSSSETRLAVEARDAAIAAQAAAEAAQAAAETAEANLETAETNAETSATNAAASASSASTSATNASNSASSASTSATNASNSASAASTSATNASNSASAASTSATNASNSASAAATSATNASNSATAALAAQVAAEAAFDAFDDIYLGAKSSNPTVDNDGNALTTGDQYFNTVSNELRVWNGSSWQAASVIGGTVTSLTVTGATALNGGTTVGDASGDALTINSSAVSIPNGLNFDSNTLVIDATNNRVGVGTASPSTKFVVQTNFGTDTLLVSQSDTSGATLAALRLSHGSGSSSFLVTGQGFSSFGTSSNDPLVINTNATERMRITSTGNVGIGTSSPASALDVNGLIRAQGSTISASGAGVEVLYASSTPWFGATNQGLVQAYNRSGSAYTPITIGGSQVAFITGSASERMRIDSSGNVGIGNSSPAFNLDVTGDIRTTNYVYGNTAFIGPLLLHTGASDLRIEKTGSYSINLYTNGSERMRVNSAGNVGIGTSSPQAYTNYQGLTLNGTTGSFLTMRQNNTGSFEIATNSTETYVKTIASTPLWFGTNNTERMRLDSSGNLGLGVTPSAWNTYTALQVKTAALWSGNTLNSFASLTANTYYQTGYKYIASDYATEYYQYNGQHIWRTAPSGTAGNAITFTQAMTLDASGNLMLGQTSASEAFEITRSGATSTGIALSQTGASGRKYIIASTGSGYGSSGNLIFFDGTAAAERMRIGSAGQIGIGGANYGSSGQVLTSAGSGAAPSWSTPSVTGISKAWAKFTPSSGSIAGSKNVSSISTGNPWRVNWSSAFANANYAVTVGNGEASGDSFARPAFISDITTGYVQFGTPQNYPLVQCVAAFND